ncbi:MAG: hypothetical protein KatS3mg050_4991 [Litorilinea sp.]|nr:MAG: hypothetical protein KatS3mg050_4991 [Litorilinea sp.]
MFGVGRLLSHILNMDHLPILQHLSHGAVEQVEQGAFVQPGLARSLDDLHPALLDVQAEEDSLGRAGVPSGLQEHLADAFDHGNGLEASLVRDNSIRQLAPSREIFRPISIPKKGPQIVEIQRFEQQANPLVLQIGDLPAPTLRGDPVCHQEEAQGKSMGQQFPGELDAIRAWQPHVREEDVHEMFFKQDAGFRDVGGAVDTVAGPGQSVRQGPVLCLVILQDQDGAGCMVCGARSGR